MSKCIICGETTKKPIIAALWHFRPVEWGQWKWWPGNIRAFGWWHGLTGSIGLSFPILNTLMNWKHRKARLSFENESK